MAAARDGRLMAGVDSGPLRELVRRRAGERGWPRIRYEAVTLYQVRADAGGRSRVIRSGLPTADDARGKAIVTVDSGRASWGAFLAQAEDADLLRANGALAALPRSAVAAAEAQPPATNEQRAQASEPPREPRPGRG